MVAFRLPRTPFGWRMRKRSSRDDEDESKVSFSSLRAIGVSEERWNLHRPTGVSHAIHFYLCYNGRDRQTSTFRTSRRKKNDFPSQYLCSRAVTFYLFVQIGLELNKIQFNFTAGRVGERRIVLIGVGFRRLYVEDLPHAQKQSV